MMNKRQDIDPYSKKRRKYYNVIQMHLGPVHIKDGSFKRELTLTLKNGITHHIHFYSDFKESLQTIQFKEE